MMSLLKRNQSFSSVKGRIHRRQKSGTEKPVNNFGIYVNEYQEKSSEMNKFHYIHDSNNQESNLIYKTCFQIMMEIYKSN